MNIYKDTYEKISNITMTDYNPIHAKDPDFEYVIVFENEINAMLEDLLMEISRLEEKYEDFKEDVEENYKRIPVRDQLGDIE